MATYSQDEIKEIIRTVAEQYGIPYWVALGIAGQESSLNPNQPGDGGKSYGLFQIHETNIGDVNKRKDPWFNATWAMQNSVGPGYQGAIAKGLTDPTQILDDVFRHGQRADPAAIAAGLPNALQWASTAGDWPGGVTGMTSLPERGTVGPETALASRAQPVTGEPANEAGFNPVEWASRVQANPDDYPLETRLVAQSILANAAAFWPSTATKTETYSIADEQARRLYDKYKVELDAGQLSLNEVLAGIQRESAVTTRAATMGQEQRSFYDMMLAPGTEYQPGYGPESPIGALRQERGASYQPRPVTQVPTAALSPQTYLQQAQQSFPEVPPVNIPPYPQMPVPTGVGTTTTQRASYEPYEGFVSSLQEATRRLLGPMGTLERYSPIDPYEWERIRRGIR